MWPCPEKWHGLLGTWFCAGCHRDVAGKSILTFLTCTFSDLLQGCLPVHTTQLGVCTGVCGNVRPCVGACTCVCGGVCTYLCVGTRGQGSGAGTASCSSGRVLPGGVAW